ncbi:cytochrome c peroxidase [Fulvivirgaceae bacterium BMA12]|uniref:Cytochrome c peroxidase n=1 Tax=Agaribacillus aureus TaxID=3051825 RepID=A0ABT8L5H0_9BACT|nr:cytochrome c peroxidase [Fulvivirgaceae bacterium BMA12]
MKQRLNKLKSKLLKISIFGSVIILVSVLLSCSEDGEVDEIEQEEIGSTENQLSEIQFTDEEMSVFNGILSLRQRMFNYAKLAIPQYFEESSGSLPGQDNTPDNNPVTDEGATLGRVLFYDVNLSANNTISCSSCHQQDKGFSDPARFSVGLNGETTKRHSMTLINSRWYEKRGFFWDERARSLEDQVLIPIQDHIEMGLELSELVAKLERLEYYDVLFNKAFGTTEINPDRISKALSQFTRSIVSYNSKFNKAVRADNLDEVPETDMVSMSTLTEQENIGLDIFYNFATCGYCHMGPAHVADSMKNNGLDLVYADKGKAEWSGNSKDNALFKPPSLANIAFTAPYMHDGRFETLMDVVNHYSDNIKAHPNLNFRLTTEDIDGTVGGTPLRLELDQEQKEALVAFLKTFTDEVISTDEKYGDPFIR